MNRQQLAHLLRAACAITGDGDVLVLGSQSILGTYDEDDLPALATASMEADIAFLDDPDRVKADQVEAAIGEMSTFHETNAFYAEGIHIDTAVLPVGWRDRLTGWSLRSSEPARPQFLDPYDLAAAKLVAGRAKDVAFVDALIRSGLLRAEVLRERFSSLPDSVGASSRARARALLSTYEQGPDRDL